MKKILLLLLVLYHTKASAQFEAIKGSSPMSLKMQKIYSVDTAVFVLLAKYNSRKISKQEWASKNSDLIKKFDALHCDRLSDSERALWHVHKQAMADLFLNAGR